MDGPSYGTPNLEYIMSWLELDDDGPMWALNLMKYKEVAEYADGRETTISGQEADDAYAPFGPLAAVGASIALMGHVAGQARGDDTVWDRIGIVRYPTRVALIEMDQREDFQELHEHKEAGMDHTIVVASFPADGEPVPDAALSSVERGELLLLQIVADATAPDVTGDLDATRIGRFEVEGTILGDDRTWAEARWDIISRETADELLAGDPVADDSAYVIVVEPVRDELAASVAELGEG